VVLEIVVGISPLLGLVGTVHGLITLFRDLGQAGLGDNTVVAKGIAIALNTTLMGLLIAIPSLVTWSYYSKKVESFGVEMESLLDDFLRRQYSQSGQPDTNSPASAPGQNRQSHRS
jgi:biopolymer transport protein ExbB